MMTEWLKTLSAADLLLMAMLIIINLLMWLCVASVSLDVRKRHRHDGPEGWMIMLPTAHSVSVLLALTLAVGAVSIWMLRALTPLI